MTYRKLRTGEYEQTETELNEGGSFIYLFCFGFWTEQYCLHRNFSSSDSENKSSCYLLVIVIAMS